MLIFLGLLCLYTGLYVARTYWRLRRFPGPLVARFTDLGRLWWVKTSRSHHHHMGLHRRYGHYVRLGPNMISISDPDAISLVYPIRPGVPKVSKTQTPGPMYQAMTSVLTWMGLSRVIFIGQ